MAARDIASGIFKQLSQLFALLFILNLVDKIDWLQAVFLSDIPRSALDQQLFDTARVWEMVSRSDGQVQRRIADVVLGIDSGAPGLQVVNGSV